MTRSLTVTMPDDNDRLLDAITDLIPKLLTTMEAFEQVQRNLHPPRLPELAEYITPYAESLRAVRARFGAVSFPEDLEAFGESIGSGTEYALRACDGLIRREEGFSSVMKAVRAHCRAQECIYPLATIMSPVSQYFLEPGARGNLELVKRLGEGAGREGVGIMNAANERNHRGGFTLYVPENVSMDEPMSLVITLHGGNGHGADFLWSWLREARTRGFLVMAPTSQRDTWSLMGEEHDLSALLSMLDHVKSRWPVDEQHILLTGMSDGATYSLLAGLRENSPFTHLAPFSGVLHPDISMSGRIKHARGRPIYLVHGKLDWMFPAEAARIAKTELEKAGALIVFREIEDLSHNYARAENPAVLAWFNPALEIPAHA